MMRGEPPRACAAESRSRRQPPSSARKGGKHETVPSSYWVQHSQKERTPAARLAGMAITMTALKRKRESRGKPRADLLA
jgi:hypothetical protein